MIKAEIWVEFTTEPDETVAEVESEFIEADSYEEIDNKLARLVDWYEEKFWVTDSGYEVITT